MADTYAKLISYAIDTDVALEEMLKCDDEHQLSVHFAIPLSEQVYDDFHQIQGVLLDLQLQFDHRGNRDVWAFVRANGPATYVIYTTSSNLLLPYMMYVVWRLVSGRRRDKLLRLDGSVFGSLYICTCLATAHQ
jgi:hypothetical protein